MVNLLSRGQRLYKRISDWLISDRLIGDTRTRGTLVCGAFISSALIGCLATSHLAAARDLVANVAQFGGPETRARVEYYARFVEALDDAYDAGRIEVHIRPFARSIREINQGVADFHLPLICPENRTSPYFDYATPHISEITFGLYSHRDMPLTTAQVTQTPLTLTAAGIAALDTFSPPQRAALLVLANTPETRAYRTAPALFSAARQQLGQPLTPVQQEALLLSSYPYVLETDRLHSALFDVPTYPSTSILSSLRKLASKRIDGYLLSVITTERIIDSEGLDELLHRDFFARYATCFVIAKGSRGGEVDQLLTAAMAKLQQSGRYQQFFKPVQNFDEAWAEHLKATIR